jgi:hypothetical protein
MSTVNESSSVPPSSRKASAANRGLCQSASIISPPPGRSQVMSLPVRKSRRRKAPCSRRSADSAFTCSSIACPSGPGCQSIQLSSESWQYGLLLPPTVRHSSSPISIMGTPCDSRSVDIKLRATVRLRASTFGSVVSPSTPQFWLTLSSRPSRLFSPLLSLCLTA